MRPWDNQKIRQRLEEQPTHQEIIQIAKAIHRPEVRAAFILMYLTAGRNSEITKNKLQIQGKKVTQGLKRKDIKFTTDNKEREIMILNLPNRKHRQRHFKTIPIPIEKERVLISILNNYLKGLSPEEYVVPLTKHYASRLVLRHSGMNPHYLRHIRLTHLVINEDFNEQLLVLFAGWTDSRPAKNYMELRWKDILQKY